MNNKGFTLIELVATIALLAVIAVISFVSINEVVKKSKVSDCESLVSNIKSAVKDYVSDNRYDLNDYNDLNITSEILINEKYLVGPIIDPFTNEEMSPNDIKISVDLNSDYTVKSITIGAPSILINCKDE